ncbi:MAG: peptidoglycan-binding domain-containing protein [Planctomycetota bacterium]
MSHPAPETHEPSPKAAAIPARPQTGLISSPIFDDLLYGEGSVLADGARGYAVKLAQTALGRAGYHLRAGADGHFGPATRNLVMRFQRESGLIPTGILDRTTLLKLDRCLEELDKGDRTEAQGRCEKLPRKRGGAIHLRGGSRGPHPRQRGGEHDRGAGRRARALVGDRAPG